MDARRIDEAGRGEGEALVRSSESGVRSAKFGVLVLMSILKGRPDAGQGGKLGHSNMDHWEFTEEIKIAARKRRRHDAKHQIKEALTDLESAEDDKQTNNRSSTGGLELTTSETNEIS